MAGLYRNLIFGAILKGTGTCRCSDQPVTPHTPQRPSFPSRPSIYGSSNVLVVLVYGHCDPSFSRTATLVQVFLLLWQTRTAVRGHCVIRAMMTLARMLLRFLRTSIRIIAGLWHANAEAFVGLIGACQCVGKARSENFELQTNTGHHSSWKNQSSSQFEQVAAVSWADSPVFGS